MFVDGAELAKPIEEVDHTGLDMWHLRGPSNVKAAISLDRITLKMNRSGPHG